MRKALLMTSALAWLALTGTAGAVTVTILADGPQDPTYFASLPAGDNGFSLDGIAWAGTSAATEKGSLFPLYAAPLGMGTSTTTGTTYMAVQAGGSETATFSTPQTSLILYWGSIDADLAGTGSAGNLNSILVNVGGYTLTGASLMAMFPSVPGNGSQTDPANNLLIELSDFTTPFTKVTFSTTGNAFEFSIVPSSVPEPATWVMMGLGFIGLGYAAFRRSAKGRSAAIAI
jgi:hypothetical protein